ASRRRHTRFSRDWSSDVCSSDLADFLLVAGVPDREIIFHYESSATSTEYIGIYQPEDYALLILSPDTMSSRISMLKKEVWMVFQIGRASLGKECRMWWRADLEDK